MEILSHRTEAAQVFANPDGRLTAEFAPTAVRVKQDNGTWAPVDTMLAARADGTVAPKAAAADLNSPAAGAARWPG